MSKTYSHVFSVFKSKDGRTTYLKPKLGKFGVKSITVELNDGTVVDLDGDQGLFAQDPRATMSRLVESGKINEDQAQERIQKLDAINLLSEVQLVTE